MENKSKASNLLSNIPLIFEKNIGQQDSQVKYILKQNGFTTFFTQSEVVSLFSKKIDENNEKDINDIDSLKFNIDKNKDEILYETNVLRMKFENLSKNSEILGQDELNCKVNYFKGSKEDWITDIEVYEKIIYKDIYENIDLVYYSNKGNLEYDFILKSEANLEDIKISFEGIDNIGIDEDENLKIDIKDSSIYLLKPKTYQLIDSDNVEVKSEFIINENKVSFKVDKYDKLKTLIIDPILLYSTYIGGSSEDFGYGIAVDSNETAYISGHTYSVDFPTTPNAYQATIKGAPDVFLVKIDTKLSGSSSLMYSSYIGGSNSDYGYGIAVDSNKVVYITGLTQSSDFPTTPNAYQAIYQSGYYAFLTKIDTKLSGSSSLIYSTYIGGSSVERGRGVAIDGDENAYITGYTYSADFPITPNAYQSTIKGSEDVFLSRIDTKLSGSSSLIYSTYIGGDDVDSGIDIAVDENKNAYITGYTKSSDFPITPNAYNATIQGDIDVFLSRIDTNLSGSSSLIYSTYLGGSNNDIGEGIAIDKNKNAYIVGRTMSTNFPTTPSAYQGMHNGGYDAFLSRIDTSLSGNSSLIYSTYIGGSSVDEAYSISIDYDENTYITGRTYSVNFPTTPNAYQGKYNGGGDIFLSRIDTKLSANSSLIYSTYIGGSSFDLGQGVAVDSNGIAYITGFTESSDFPTTPNAYQATISGSMDTFLVKMRTQGPFVNLQMNKATDLQFVDLGTTITYTITLNNNGNVSANNIILIDTIPNGTTFIPNSLSINGVTVPQSPDGINIGSVNAEDTMTITFKIKVDTIPTPNPIENSAVANYTYTKYLSIPEGENGSSNSNIVTTKVNHVDMLVNKTTYPVYISCDGTITYTITLQNIGSTTAENMIFRDTIPNQTRFIPNSLKVDGTTISGQNPAVGVNIGNIGPNSIKTVTFEVTALC